MDRRLQQCWIYPIAHATLSSKVDPRKLVFGGVMWLGMVTLLRTTATTDMGYWDVSQPIMLMGLGDSSSS